MHKIKRLDINCISINSVLAFISGLPLLLLSSTLQAWYSQKGVDLFAIGSLSLLGLPYTLKFLWSPLLDSCGFSSDSPRRIWILISQFCVFTSLLILSFLDPINSPYLMIVFAFIASLSSATQDMAVDAYRQVITPKRLRALVVGYVTTSYRLAMVVAGGFALVAADNYGWSTTYKLMTLLLMMGFMFTWSMPRPQEYDFKDSTPSNIIKNSFANLLEIKNIKTILVIIIFYKLGDAFLLNFLQPFLLQGLHYSLTYVGYLVKVFGLLATIAGAFFSSFFMKRCGFYNLLLGLGLLQLISMLSFVGVAVYPVDRFVILSVFLESFAAGATSCLLVVLFMNLCRNTRYAATQISFLSALSALPRVALGPFAGYLVGQLGWLEFFMVGVLATLPGIIILCYFKRSLCADVAVVENNLAATS
jgi:MFS transporter, PAT family, beta-lactamase induction signal transducer AmpG